MNRHPAPDSYKGVIFDLDGTLLDTIDDIAGAMNRVLERHHCETFDIAKYKILVGDGIEEMVARALAPRVLSPADMAAFIAEYRREYELSWRLHSRPYPGVPVLLRALEARGVRTAVLSNKSDAFTRAMVAELLPGFRFDAVRGALPSVPLKPDPTVALSIVKDMGLLPDDVAFVGDTKVDMAAARAAGLCAVGALWGFRTAEELTASGADLIIASPLDLLARCFRDA
jgi:phosphoglycolate phosphatase